MKLGKVIIFSYILNLVYLPLFAPKIQLLSIFSLTYLHLPVFTYIWPNVALTRLLGRPQPQMYPPVALNQYTWVNRTHKHFLYMLQSYPPTTCKIWK